MKYTASFAVLSAAGLLLVPAYSRRPDFGTIYKGFPGEVDVDALVAKFDPGPDGNFLDGLDYVAPGPGDVRSPCPFLNALANHGLVDRSGKDINVFELAAMSVFYDLGGPGFFGFMEVQT